MPIRVLVVDDSPTIRRVVGAVLQRHGFEAISAPDGQAALDQLVRSTRPPEVGDEPHPGRIDVVLVDFVMPRMNGFQLCRAIRQNDALRSTPVVLMSAKSDRIRDHFVQQTGAIDAISKPFDARALVAVIENAIRRTEQWRARGDADFSEVLEDIESVEPVSATEPIGAGHAALAGDLAIIPVGAALQLLQIESQSGVLVVTDGKTENGTEVSISMRQGLIDLVMARGAGNEFRLGRYFVEHGLVTSEDIEAILRDRPSRRESSPQGHKRIGDLLVDAGRITPDQLRDALARQSSELVYDVLRWPRGRFEFRRESHPPLAESARLGLPVASVVMEGFRRVDEWRMVEAGLGNFDSVLMSDPASVQAVGTGRLAKSEQRLLEMVDGERTLREIVEHSHMSSFDACKILFQLLEARLVRRRTS
jgi:DNA-binding response OmpR family regulator